MDVQQLVEDLVALQPGGALLETPLFLEGVHDALLATVLLGFLEVEELVAVGREGALAELSGLLGHTDVFREERHFLGSPGVLPGLHLALFVAGEADGQVEVLFQDLFGLDIEQLLALQVHDLLLYFID